MKPLDKRIKLTACGTLSAGAPSGATGQPLGEVEWRSARSAQHPRERPVEGVLPLERRTRYDLELEKDHLGSRLENEVRPVRAAG